MLWPHVGWCCCRPAVCHALQVKQSRVRGGCQELDAAELLAKEQEAARAAAELLEQLEKEEAAKSATKSSKKKKKGEHALGSCGAIVVPQETQLADASSSVSVESLGSTWNHDCRIIWFGPDIRLGSLQSRSQVMRLLQQLMLTPLVSGYCFLATAGCVGLAGKGKGGAQDHDAADGAQETVADAVSAAQEHRAQQHTPGKQQQQQRLTQQQRPGVANGSPGWDSQHDNQRGRDDAVKAGLYDGAQHHKQHSKQALLESQHSGKGSHTVGLHSHHHQQQQQQQQQEQHREAVSSVHGERHEHRGGEGWGAYCVHLHCSYDLLHSWRAP